VVANQPDCHLLAFPKDVYPQEFVWMTNGNLAYRDGRSSIYILDMTTFTTQTIELPSDVYSEEIRAIPNTENLLVYDPAQGVGEKGELFLLDTTNKSIRPVADLPDTYLHIMELAPDGKSVLLAGGKVALWIDLSSGGIIQAFPTYY